MLNVSEHLMVSKYLLGLILATFPEAKEKANRFKRRSSLICFQETFRKKPVGVLDCCQVEWNRRCFGLFLGYIESVPVALKSC